jgi:hypothetical protein
VGYHYGVKAYKQASKNFMIKHLITTLSLVCNEMLLLQVLSPAVYKKMFEKALKFFQTHYSFNKYIYWGV